MTRFESWYTCMPYKQGRREYASTVLTSPPSPLSLSLRRPEISSNSADFIPADQQARGKDDSWAQFLGGSAGICKIVLRNGDMSCLPCSGSSGKDAKSLEALSPSPRPAAKSAPGENPLPSCALVWFGGNCKSFRLSWSCFLLCYLLQMFAACSD
jgi:hypothetical protein